MKSSSKAKVILNILLLVGIFGLMYYFLRNSLADILNEMKETSLLVLIGVLILGLTYQVIEGRGIREIAKQFQPDFSSFDGILTACYVAFYRVITFGAGTLISEVNFYRRKNLAVFQGVGVTALHLIMYKAAMLTYALAGLVIQFSLFYSKAPNMIYFIIAGMILTFVIIAALLTLALSIGLQTLFIKICHRLFKSAKLRDWVDQINLQIYSLREAIYSVLRDRTTLIRIYLLNLLKMIPWYVIPYFVLVQGNPHLDFLLCFALISFSVILAGVIPTPAGIGSFEFVYLLLFKPLVGTATAVSSMLLYRLASYVLPFFLGFVYVVFDKRRTIKQELNGLKKEAEEC